MLFCPLAMKYLYDYIQQPPIKIAIYGPVSSLCCESVSSVAKYWNLVQGNCLFYFQISNAATSATLSDRKLYPYFYRTALSDVAYNVVRQELFRLFNWDKVAIIHQTLSLFQASAADLEHILKKGNITVVASEAFAQFPERHVPLLKDKDARIIIVYAYPDMAQRIFCTAYHLNYYGPNHVWFLLGWYFDNWWKSDLSKNTNCTEEQILKVMDGYFAVLGVEFGFENVTTISGLTPKKYLEEYKNFHPDYYLASVHTWAYDAVWSLALALNNTEHILRQNGRNLTQFHYNDSNTRQILMESFNQLSFQGISGPVSFEQGERVADVRILQMITRIKTINTVQVGLYDSHQNEIRLGSPYNPVYWRGGYIPKDEYIRKTIILRISSPIFIAFTILSILGIILSLFFFVFNVFNRKLRYIKMSSPNLNNVILVGGVLCYLSVIVFGLESYTITCQIRGWLLAIGFTLSFGSLFSKTWRVHRIYHNKHKMRVVIRDTHLFIMVFFLVMIDVIILMTWQFVDPLYSSEIIFSTQVDPTNIEYLIISKHRVCICGHYTIWLGILYSYKFLLLIFGAFLAWETRNVSIPALNDSKYIGLSIYNVVVLCVVGVLITIFVNNQVDISFALIASFIVFCTTLMSCFVFVPKIRYFKTDPDEQKNMMASRSVGKVASVVHQSYLPASRDDVLVLKRQLSERDKEIQNLSDIIKKYENKDSVIRDSSLVNVASAAANSSTRTSIDLNWARKEAIE
ncbi:expressed hypothetical protein [Trichoplax adhaerens]|uniref:Gamma-aminobutyric acid type B receptor subunit 2 n=1 Tax=Trichoplax adhaerens TaxID=10228 RepID=B3S473_TRIAD|nr:expressed hypothetical protein [Trichoplax adhaerens]EDV22406.1 expressed hypothetical protein [Trichoplax adhaerens]|eukprot:XP_002114950.1 expressed hypothetical protein [Trichoplax adhaerens]